MLSHTSSPSTYPPPAHGHSAGASPLHSHEPPSLFDNISPVLVVLAIVFTVFAVFGVSYLLIRKSLRTANSAQCVEKQAYAQAAIIPVIVITPPRDSEVTVSLVINEEDEYDDAEKGQPRQKCADLISMVQPLPPGDTSSYAGATKSAKGPPLTPEELEEIRLGDALLDEACLYALTIVKLRNAARRGFLADAVPWHATERYDTIPLPIKEVNSKLVHVQSETEIAKAHACAEEAEVTLPQSAIEYDSEMEGLLSALGLADSSNGQESEPTSISAVRMLLFYLF